VTKDVLMQETSVMSVMFHRNDSLACGASTEALGAVRLLRARRVALEQELTRNVSDAEEPVRD
jgi:hypothetical protein